MVSFFCAVLARAEPFELTRQQASELFAALNKIDPGLSAENVVIAADNLNALRPTVEALDRGKLRASRDMDILPVTEERAAKLWAIRDAIDAKADEKVTIELRRMELSPDELKTAKIRPADLAVIRRHLKPK